MSNVYLDAELVYETHRDPETPDIQQAIAEGGGGAVTGITSGTITVTAPGDGSRNIELPQALATNASPAFNGLNIGAGTLIKKIQSGTVSVDPPSIAATSTGTVDVTITGLAVGDRIMLHRPDGLNDDLIYAGHRINAANTLRIYLYNPTAGAIDDGSLSWEYLWFDLT